MAQSFALGAPELAGFSVVGGTAGASLSSWLLPGGDAHVFAGCFVGAVALPLICILPQLAASCRTWAARLPQLVRLPLGGEGLAGGDQSA